MMIVRPLAIKDSEALYKFASTTHLGVTSLFPNKEFLRKKIELSISSFTKDVKTPGNELYLFIIEDITTMNQGGTCGIWAKTGITEPIFFYQIETIYHDNHIWPLPSETKVLHAISYEEGPTEICGLYLLPEFRHSGIGRLLSLSRFLFMASFPQRFGQIILSNMRGVIDDNNHCPFWDGFGKKFLNIEFCEVMEMISRTREFIPYFLPKYPVYVSLLAEQVKRVIARPHPHTKPALNMLIKQGFRTTNEVDIFDGGPIITARTSDIQCIREYRTGIIDKITSSELDSEIYIMSNNSLDFRACFSKIQFNSDNHLMIHKTVANALQVNEGDSVGFIPKEK